MPVLKQLICAEYETGVATALKEANQYLLKIQRAGYWVKEIKLRAYGIVIEYIIEEPPTDFNSEWLTDPEAEMLARQAREKVTGTGTDKVLGRI